MNNLIRNKYACTNPKCKHTTVQTEARRCPMCGAPVVEVINGAAAVEKAKKQAGLYLEGMLTIPLIMAIANVSEHFWAAFGSMALIATLMVVVIPMATGMIPRRRPARRRRAKASN